jgi:hypothetical protein
LSPTPTFSATISDFNFTSLNLAQHRTEKKLKLKNYVLNPFFIIKEGKKILNLLTPLALHFPPKRAFSPHVSKGTEMENIDHTLSFKMILLSTGWLYYYTKNEQIILSFFHCQKCPLKKINVYSIIAKNYKFQCLYIRGLHEYK